MERRVRLVSSESLVTVRSGAILKEAHAADADVQVEIGVEGHAQGVAADMGEDLDPFVVGGEDAHHVAVAAAAIHVVLGVEDHVLGAVEFSETDRLHPAQPVVQGVGRVRALRGVRQGRQLEVGGRDIGAREDLVAVLHPAHVDGDRQKEHTAEDQGAGAAHQAHLNQAVLHDDDDDGAERRLDHRSAPAAKADAAEDDSGEDGDLHAASDVGAGTGKTCGIEAGRQPAERAGEHVGRADGALDADPGVVGRPARAADGHDVPAEADPGQHDMRGDADDGGDDEARRDAEDPVKRHPLPGRRGVEAARDGHRVVEQKRVNEGPHDDEHDERGQEGAQPEVADQHPIYQPHARAHEHDERNAQRQVPFEVVDDRERHEVAEREDRPHREVDAARHHHHGHADSDEEVLPIDPADVRQVRRREEGGVLGSEQHQHRRQDEGGDQRVDPGLRQDLSDHLIGDPARPPPGPVLGCRHALLLQRAFSPRGPQIADRARSGRGDQPPEAFSSSSVQHEDGVSVSLVMYLSGV